MKWNIITDTSSELFPAVREGGEIEISTVPFTISVGDTDFVDDENLDRAEMLRAMEAERSASRTNCPPPDAWLEQYERADCSFAITISANLSGSMNSAVAAREMALQQYPEKKITVLDSCSAGPELALCAQEIERLIGSGFDFDEISRRAADYLRRKKTLFVLSSFDNLVKNGRMSRLTGSLAKVLGMWGIGSGSDIGTIVMEGKARGAKKALQMLISLMKERGFSGDKVAISHCENPAFAETLKERIREIWENTEVEIMPTRGLCSYYAERHGLIISF